MIGLYCRGEKKKKTEKRNNEIEMISFQEAKWISMIVGEYSQTPKANINLCVVIWIGILSTLFFHSFHALLFDCREMLWSGIGCGLVSHGFFFVVLRARTLFQHLFSIFIFRFAQNRIEQLELAYAIRISMSKSNFKSKSNIDN